MDTNLTSLVGDALAALPPEGVERELALDRAAELAAARTALRALQAAAARASEAALRPAPGATRASLVEADALSATSRLWQGGDPRWPKSDERALHDLRRAASNPDFPQVVRAWIVELRATAGARPNSGACTTASALQLWLWTLEWFRRGPEKRETAVAELVEALGALVASRCQILALRDAEPFFAASHHVSIDLCHVYAARSASLVSALCAELVHGYRRHPAWNDDGCAGCYSADELDELEGLMPGIASAARGHSDVIESDGSHRRKAGPCVRFNEIEGFTRLRAKLDGCLTGARRAQERVAVAFATVAPLSPARS